MPVQQTQGADHAAVLVALRQAEESLREREARLNAILGRAADGILTVDERGRIESLNPAAERLFGYNASALVGQELRVLVPEPNRRAHHAALLDCVAGRRPLPACTQEVPGLRRDGSVILLELTLSEVPLGDRHLYTAFVRDVTERRRAEQHLLHTQRLAAIGEAMTGLMHEARNALQRGQSCVEMLRIQLEDRPEALRLLGRLEQAQDDLHRLYEEVREYAQPIRPQPEPCDLRQLLREAWDRLADKWQGRLVELRERGAAPTRCLADPFAIRSALLNLLENALEACTDPVVIEVAYEVDPARDAFRIRISDDGPGIPPDLGPSVLEPFVTTKDQGIGLGIPIARRLLQAHGGDLTLEPDRVRGAEFVATLPRRFRSVGPDPIVPH